MKKKKQISVTIAFKDFFGPIAANTVITLSDENLKYIEERAMKEKISTKEFMENVIEEGIEDWILRNTMADEVLK